MNPPGRFWLGILIALLVSIPFCWLLSFAALLPFYIGLFFFALFGLVFGAVVCRVAARRGPYGSGTVLAGTTLLVFAVWGGSLVKESWDLPGDLAEQARRRTRDLKGKPVDQFLADISAEVRAEIDETYPPGGPVGYVRWALAGGTFKKGELTSADVSLKLNQARYIFAGRLVLSVALLAFGVASQTWTLKVKTPRASASPSAGRSGDDAPATHAEDTSYSPAHAPEGEG